MAVMFVCAHAAVDAVQGASSPLAEMTALLHALADPTHHRPAAPALSRAVDGIGPSLAREVQELSPLWSGYLARFLLPGPAGGGRSMDEELALVASYPTATFLESAAWAVRGGYTGSPASDSMLSDAAARDEVLGRARGRSREAGQLAFELFDDPDAVRERIVTVLHACDRAFFAAEWGQLAGHLDADVRARVSLSHRAGPVAVIASLTRAATVLLDPPRVRIEKIHHGLVDLAVSRLLVVPSLFTWPHVLVKHETGWPPVVLYPVRDYAPLAEQTSIADVQVRLSALVEPTRLRLCRLVAREPATTTDLAARTGMSPPQVSRHLRVLRDARVLERVRDGRLVRYQLCLDEVGRLGPDLLAALLR